MRFSTIVVPLMMLVVVSSASASRAHPKAGWSVRCPVAVEGYFDPIVAPGISPFGHRHYFLGNLGTNPNATYTSQTASGTTCAVPQDTGTYWVPVLYNNGAEATVYGKPIVYYRDKDVTKSVASHVVAFPPDFRMVEGRGHATTPADNPDLGSKMWYQCDDGSKAAARPPRSCSDGMLDAVVTFPDCWDGQRTHKDDSAHVRYAVNGGCPAPFSTPVGRAQITMRYVVGTGPLSISLSSGPWYTLHADFWNTWQQPALKTLTTRCLNADVDCGANPTV